jgi:hypothetical protein
MTQNPGLLKKLGFSLTRQKPKEICLLLVINLPLNFTYAFSKHIRDNASNFLEIFAIFDAKNHVVPLFLVKAIASNIFTLSAHLGKNINRHRPNLIMRCPKPF